MYRVLSCLTAQHDFRLVALAALICAAAAVASFKIYSYVATSHGLRRSSLLLLTGICSASGIWATHFIAMLAYQSGLPIAYDPITTTASLLIAMIATTTGFAVAASPESVAPRRRRRRHRRRHRPHALHRYVGAHRSGQPAVGDRARHRVHHRRHRTGLGGNDQFSPAASGPRAPWIAAALFHACDLRPPLHRDGRGDHRSRCRRSSFRRRRSTISLMAIAVSVATHSWLMLSSTRRHRVDGKPDAPPARGGAPRPEPAFRHGARQHGPKACACSTPRNGSLSATTATPRCTACRRSC